METGIDTALLKKVISESTARSRQHYLIKAALNCISYDSFLDIFDWNYNYPKELKFLFFNLIDSRFSGDKTLSKELADRLLISYKSQSKYNKKVRCALYISHVIKHLNNEHTDDVIKSFLQSEYRIIRNMAYEYLKEHWKRDYYTVIEKNWQSYSDKKIREILLAISYEEYMYELVKNVVEDMSEEVDGEYYSLQAKINRNQLIAKNEQLKNELIGTIKEKDPISFVYIQYLNKEKIDEKYALELYFKHETGYRYLPVWYSEMGMTGVINTILKKVESSEVNEPNMSL